jgi:hypothetical protein
MNISGIDFDLCAADGLNRAELNYLVRSATPGEGDARVTVELCDERHAWARAGRFAAISGSRLETDGGLLRLGNRCFSAEIDLEGRCVSLHRDDASDTSLRLAMRAAITAVLPQLGWLPLHASAVDTGGSALVFCGRSGAGKSTLAATSPYAVLSDEMVSVSIDSLQARGTSFWGDSVCKAPLSATGVPLRAIVLLGKSQEFSLTIVTPSEAMRALVGATLVPVGNALWPAVLEMLAGLVDRVEVWNMAWWKDTPPWTKLAKAGLCGLRGRDAEGADLCTARTAPAAGGHSLSADSSDHAEAGQDPTTAQFGQVDR